MATRNSKNFEYGSLKPSPKKSGLVRKEYASVLPPQNEFEENAAQPQTFAFGNSIAENRKSEEITTELKSSIEPFLNEDTANTSSEIAAVSYDKQQRITKDKKRELKRKKLLSKDIWLVHNGHTLSFVGIYIFTTFVFLRPYELVPGLSCTHY